MALQVFVVVPYEGKWGVSAGGEVLATAKTKAAAQDLARKAAKALQAGEPAPEPGHVRIHERRSFIDS
jgi:hypothetical protein